MSDLGTGRRPRSAARRAGVRAQIGSQGSPPLAEPDISLPFEARPAPPPPIPWEDTTATQDVPVKAPFFSRRSPLFGIVLALVFIALLITALLTGIRAWRAYELERAEARRLKLLAEEKAKYKFPYRALIEDYAQEAGVDPALVAAVIYHESRFDPAAVSGAGARGLMQIMKDTGDWIAYRLGELSSYTQDSLFDAETSIRYGTWFLGYLSRMFGGDMVSIVAGYHAGQYAVQGWLENPEYSPDGLALSVIPYADTEQYVSRVVNAYEIYIKHYYTPEETPDPQANAS